MANSTRRWSYDDDPSSTQNLWIIVLVVAAMVLSFLFGKYFIGDRIRGGESQAAAPAAPPTTVAPPTPMAAVPTAPGAAAPVDGAVSITPAAPATPA
ncbi:MAG: hypothetical protein HYU66_26485, partial [Armatimonadetes bacterium]|nr:hypothetical protein [Armatimonadota bacterium]